MIRLNPKVTSYEAEWFEKALRDSVIGQPRAVRVAARAFQTWRAGFSPLDKPIANLLLLGPTGTGKTRLVEAFSEVLFGSTKAMIRVDCNTLQHDHEISKLIGSPPGYRGSDDPSGPGTPPVFSQKALGKHWTAQYPVSIVLFDEIEKGSPSLWRLLLGIMDKAILELANNTTVDFSQAIIFLTSNLGSGEMKNLLSGGLGFSAGPTESGKNLDDKIYQIAKAAASRNFSPEFMNRIDRLIVFHTLEREHLQKILEIELTRVQDRISRQAFRAGEMFSFHCTPAAKDFLVREGTNPKYGARELRRAIEKYLTNPLANCYSSGQLVGADVITVDYEEGGHELVFSRKEPESTSFQIVR